VLVLLRREFLVSVGLEQAWVHLADVERWPSWARHIKRIELRPAGPLGPASSGVIRLRNGVKSTFRMVEFDPPKGWMWSGRFLWLTVDYNHRFEAAGPSSTRLIWTVAARGFGAMTLGRLFAWIYARNLDRAIPRLIEEMATGHGSSGA